MDRYVYPLLIPLAAIAGAFVIVFSISRILLSFSREVTPFVALGIALFVLLGSAVLALTIGRAEAR